MARCPFLKVDDTGWFSWDWYCELTGEKIGDDSHKTKVENLCDTEYGTRYENCPTYQHR